MAYISSDTNIWIDFLQIGRLQLPFQLSHVYCMSADTMHEELTSPCELESSLCELGLQLLEINQTELEMVMDFGALYPKLSTYDRIALAIAKCRGYILLTGDKPLRTAAIAQQVEVHGTLWVVDELLHANCITQREYIAVLQSFLDDTSGKIRLPMAEIRRRIQQMLHH